jgi:hypothetical protein
MLANRTEHHGTVIGASASGLVLLGPARGVIGEKVIVYIDDQIGRVEGELIRYVRGGFAINVDLPAHTAAALGRLGIQPLG